MASAGLEELAEDLECPICREGLTVPKVLSCKHVFCADCLSQMLKRQTILCPICRTEHVFSARERISDLPEPLIIRQLQEKISLFLSANQFSSPISSDCGFCPGRATNICSACMKSLCDTCAERHRNNRITRTHQLIVKSKWTVCQRHQTELVHAYCRECNIGLCVLCSNSDHAAHDVIDIRDQALVREKTDELKQFKEKAGRHSFNNDQLLRDLNMYTQNLTKKYDVALERLEDLRKDVNKTIDDVQDELKKQLTIEQRKLHQYKTEIDDIVATEKSMCTFIDDVLQRHSAPDVIGACAELPEIGVNSVSVPPKCKIPHIGENEMTSAVTMVREVVTMTTEPAKVQYTPVTPPVGCDASMEGTQGREAEEPACLPADPEDQEVATWVTEHFAQARGEMRQVWETTLRRPISDVVWDREGAGWWMRTYLAPSGRSGGLCYYDIGGSTGGKLGQGVLQGKGAVCIDADRNLLVTTDDGRRILGLNREGEVQKDITLGGFKSFSGIAHCNHNNQYIVSDLDTRSLLYVHCDDGNVINRVGNHGNQGSPECEFISPLYVCHQSLDNGQCQVVVSDYKAHCVKVFGPRGDYIRRFGREGLGCRELKGPLGVKVSGDGRVLVCDSENVRVVSFWWDEESTEEKWEVVLTKQQLGYRAPHCIDIFNGPGQYLVLGMKGCEGVVRGFIYGP